MSEATSINQRDSDLLLKRGVIVELMRGNSTPDQGELERYLRKEAGSFNAKIDPSAVVKINDAINAGRMQGMFATVAQEVGIKLTAGASLVFETAYPEWDSSIQGFRHKKALYIEDESVSRRVSGAYKDQYGTGIGTEFMTNMAKLAAEMGASAIICEQRWHEDKEAIPITRIFDKFHAKIARNPDEKILTLASPLILQPQERLFNQISVLPLLRTLPDETLQTAQFTEAVEYRSKGRTNAVAVAATGTFITSSFTGRPTLQVNMASNGRPPINGGAKKIYKAVFAAMKKEAVNRQWITHIDDDLDFRIRAPERAIRNSLLEARTSSRFVATERRVGDCPTYPVFMDLGTVPAQFGLTLTTRADFRVERPSWSFWKAPPPPASGLALPTRRSDGEGRPVVETNGLKL